MLLKSSYHLFQIIIIIGVITVCYMLTILYNGQKKVQVISTYEHKPTTKHHTGNGSLFANDTVNDCITKETVIKTNTILTDLDGESFTRLQGSNWRESSVDELRQQKFIQVFRKKLWGGGVDETSAGSVASGDGSTLYYAQEATAMLHILIDGLKLKLGQKQIRLLDIPCGDFQWMYRFLQTRNDVLYTGMDIVPDLINRHTEKFKSNPWRFMLHDAVKSNITESHDLVLVRHVLQHLTYTDAIQMLAHISNSGSKYLLVTTFPEHKDTEHLAMTNTGGFREVNLQLEPISLPPPLCFHKDGPRQDGGYLALWELPLKQIKDCSSKKSYMFKSVSFHTCYNKR